MRTRRVVPILAVLLTVSVSGCVPRLQQPEVWMTGARLVSLGIRGGVIDVELGVHNPNDFPVRADGLTYDLDFRDPDGEDWLDFAEGRIGERLRVAAGDTASVVVPVEFSYRALGDAIRALLDRGSFEYRVSGVVAVEEPIVRDIRYRHAGTVTPSGVR